MLVLTKMLSRCCANGEEDNKNVEQGTLDNIHLVPSAEIVANCHIRLSKTKNSVSP
jgi:hypothetical protein